MPVGFKNATGGDVKAAVNGIIAATQSQTFLGITEDGRASAVTTGGNPDCQLILRGGSGGAELRFRTRCLRPSSS